MQDKVTLHLDNSPESELLRKALIRSKVPFTALYAVGEQHYPMPAYETKFGIIYGWANIKAYFQLPVD